MEEILTRAMTELPLVGQSDLLHLLDGCSALSIKECNKLYKHAAKNVSPAHNQARLDVDSVRHQRLEVVPNKTLIETITLTNNKKVPIVWKVLRPAINSSQVFMSCTPSSGTLDKGKSCEIRVCVVLFNFRPFLELLSIHCSTAGVSQIAYIPIILQIVPNSQGIKEEYWSVDFSELNLDGALVDAPATSSLGLTPAPTTPPQAPSPNLTSSGSKALSNGPTSTISTGTATLYGQRVFVRRWALNLSDMPPPECIEEIATLLQVAHPSLAGFIGGRAERGQAYVISKLLEGSYEQHLKLQGNKPSQTVPIDLPSLVKRLDMITDVAFGLSFLHGKGYVHRHLSSATLVLDDKGKLKISEFAQSAHNPVTLSCYLAPEVYEHPENASPASDVFAFGVIIWETIATIKPARSPADLANGILPPLPCDVSMFPDLTVLISLCCQKDPALRPNFSLIIPELHAIVDSVPNRTPFHFALTRNKTIKDDTISKLPRSLVYLDLAANRQLTSVGIEQLPIKLAHLDLCDCPNLTDYAIELMPPTLLHLDLSSSTKLTDQAIPAMPRALTFLSLRDCSNLTEACLPNLPPGLSTLNILNASAISEKSLPKFPKLLTDLVMPCVWLPTFSNESIKLLPASLTALHLATNTSLSPDGLKYLPPSIRTLNLQANRNFSNAALAELPPLLSDLNISSANSITDDGIQFLPKSLQHLNMSGNKNVGHLGVRVLPGCLLSLNLSSSQSLWDLSVKSLPRALTSLILSKNKQITDLGIRDLPPSLTELNLAENKNLTDACAKFFPASLKILNLYRNGNFTDACIRHLPRSLTDLNLGTNANLSDICVPDLPRSLRLLNLHNTSEFTDTCIKYLPRNLTHLDLTESKSLTDDCLLDLPTNLVTLELWNNRNISTAKVRARLPSIRVLALNLE